MTPAKPLPLSEALVQAITLVKGMFTASGLQSTLLPELPNDVEELKAIITQLHADKIKLEEELIAAKRLKRGVKPKVEDAVKLILESEELTEIPIPMIAEIIQKIFTAYKITCNCSEKSVRWYMSQRNLEWDIKKRRLPKLTQEVQVNEPNKPS